MTTKKKLTVAEVQSIGEPEPDTVGPIVRETLSVLKRVVAASWGTKSLPEVLAGMEQAVIPGRPVVAEWVNQAVKNKNGEAAE